MPSQLSTYLSADFITLAVLVVGTLAYAFMVSRGKLLPILMATYMAFVLVEFAPFLDQLSRIIGLDSPFLFRLIVFAVLFLLILYILSGVVFQSPVGSETIGLWMALVFAFLQIGFLLAVVFSFLPEDTIRGLSERLLLVFGRPTSLFVWAAAPVLFLLLIGRRVNRRLSDDEFEYSEDYEDYEDELEDDEDEEE